MYLKVVVNKIYNKVVSSLHYLQRNLVRPLQKCEHYYLTKTATAVELYLYIGHEKNTPLI